MSILPLALLTLPIFSQPVTVDRSTGPAPVVGNVTLADQQGLHIQTSTDMKTVVVPWYELLDQAPPEYAARAMRAWQAHDRVERGDISGAMPLYVSMGEAYLWEQGPQSMDVCDGLVRCYKASGRRVLAIEPMLAWFEAESLPGAEDAPAPERFDDRMRIRTDLPPVFADRTDGSLSAPDPRASGRTKLIHAYFAAVLAEEGDRPDVLGRIQLIKREYKARDPGLIFLEQMVFAQAHPERTARIAARDALLRRTQSQRDTWIEVWSRLGLGVSLIRDEDPHARDLGVVHLIHIIVRLPQIDPGLTMLAAEIADSYLRSTQRSAWGSKLVQDARMNLLGTPARPGTAGEQTQ